MCRHQNCSIRSTTFLISPPSLYAKSLPETAQRYHGYVPALVTLLRGVNVGSANRMKMEALRKVYESLGLRAVTTYLQSGNVVFLAPEHGLATLPGCLETAIEKAFGFRPRVIARTGEELRQVVAANPFARRSGIEPAKLLVTFLAEHPSDEANQKLREIPSAPEEIHLVGRELYIHYPNGLGRPKVPWTSLEKLLKIPGTGRNWNTVINLLDLVGRLES
jgi:uncharacterized protein (DUF1697 family)